MMSKTYYQVIYKDAKAKGKINTRHYYLTGVDKADIKYFKKISNITLNSDDNFHDFEYVIIANDLATIQLIIAYLKLHNYKETTILVAHKAIIKSF